MTKVWIINHYAIPPSLGGLNRHYYFKKYAPEDLDISIFTASQIHNSAVNMITDKQFIKKMQVDGVDYNFIKTSAYKGNGFSRIKNMLQFAFRVKKIAKKVKDSPDVIYTSSPDIFTAHYSLKLAKKLKVPCIVEVRDLWPESICAFGKKSKKNPLIKILYRLEKSIYKRADKIVFTMEGGKDYILEKGWDKVIPIEKIYHINNGVDLEEFNEHKKNCTIQDDDLDSQAFKIIYMGSIRPANNVELIVKAAEILKDKLPNALFLIYGDGTHRQALEKYCKENALENVKFKGKIDKKYVPYVLSKAGLNCLVYQDASIWKYGGSQNKAFEYLASGKPTLLNIKMSYSVFDKYSCGIGTEGDEYAFALGIKEIYNLTQEQYEELCNNALKASFEFDFKKQAQDFFDIINQTI